LHGKELYVNINSRALLFSAKGVFIMGKVKSAFEKAMEKIENIENLTRAEKEALKNHDRLKSLLADFYRGHLTRDDLWQQLKGSNPSLLQEVQKNMLGSIRLSIAADEFNQRKDGILAIETLKEKQNTSAIENLLSTLEVLQREYREGKERAVEELRAAMEENPQMRLRPVKTADGRTVLQAAPTVDEAVQARLAEFLSEHENRYEEMFTRGIEQLKGQLT
jgi:hypothetical protein